MTSAEKMSCYGVAIHFVGITEVCKWFDGFVLSRSTIRELINFIDYQISSLCKMFMNPILKDFDGMGIVF